MGGDAGGVTEFSRQGKEEHEKKGGREILRYENATPKYCVKTLYSIRSVVTLCAFKLDGWMDGLITCQGWIPDRSDSFSDV